ncbi:MAG: adenylate/guanylate cyclase domain-containing protein [Cyanobacteria bacterium J06627_28]
MNTSSTHTQVQRSLAAIVITDAVGFSRWMSQDEDTALTIINRDLQIIKDLCISFEGKILKTTGDGVLMYFISGVQAASCAIEIQRKFTAFTQNDQADEHFTHRIGVHLGDIFFNQDDMMGTGVNVAARLESEAKPGAVCMSQVVYEVVKYRLNLDAVYAGELSLKNIEQNVSAYHVWPSNVRHNKSPEQFSEAIFSLVTPLNTTLKVFSSHPQSPRIKKLLYAAHQGVWENDPDILKSISLKLLVESLTSRNANLIDCKNSLNTIIKRLSQPERYKSIAQTIVENVKDFYVENSDRSPIGLDRSSELKNTESASQNNSIQHESHLRSPSEMRDSLNSIIRNFNSSSKYIPISELVQNSLKEFCVERSDGSRIDISHPSELAGILEDDRVDTVIDYREISERLEASKDSIRIKQLLYCVCCNQWETHMDRIQAVPMLSLIQGLHQHVKSLELLKKQLHNILSRLDCRSDYAPVANEIFRESRLLYQDFSKSSLNLICLRRKTS